MGIWGKTREWDLSKASHVKSRVYVMFLFPKVNWVHSEKSTWWDKRDYRQRSLLFLPHWSSTSGMMGMFTMLLSLGAKGRTRESYCEPSSCTSLCGFGVHVNLRLTHVFQETEAHWTANASRQWGNHSDINMGNNWGQPQLLFQKTPKRKFSVDVVRCEWSWKLQRGRKLYILLKK